MSTSSSSNYYHVYRKGGVCLQPSSQEIPVNAMKIGICRQRSQKEKISQFHVINDEDFDGCIGDVTFDPPKIVMNGAPVIISRMWKSLK